MHETTTGSGLLGHPLIRRLIQLNLERDNFVIFGSGPLLAHGIRKNIHDLDIVARGSAWRRVRDQGIPSAGKISNGPATCFWDGRIQFFREWISTDWDTDDLIDQAEIIEGLRFAQLVDVLAYKRMLMRPKDIMDIHAIAKLISGRLGWAAPSPSAGWIAPKNTTGDHRLGKLLSGVTADEDDLWATQGHSPGCQRADRVGSSVALTVQRQTDLHCRRTSSRGSKVARPHNRTEMSPIGDHAAAAVVWSIGDAVAEPTEPRGHHGHRDSP
jgi:hypothetical protein